MNFDEKDLNLKQKMFLCVCGGEGGGGGGGAWCTDTKTVCKTVLFFFLTFFVF